MLDVARHFFPVSVVERYLDELALYEVNYFHLYLPDDQAGGSRSSACRA
jgi:hexosaminidase